MTGTVLARVYVVRHGETDSNRDKIIQGHLDTQLNATGLAQAAVTAEALRHVCFDKAFTSDLQRASQTAEKILQYHSDIELIKDSALRERFMGEMQGKKAPCNEGVSSIETGEALFQRCITWYDRVIATYISSIAVPAITEDRCRNILVLSHGAFLSTLFRAMISSNYISCPTEWKARHPRLGNTSISIVEYRAVPRGKHREVDAVILQYGDISHLHGLRVMEENADVEAN
ncbi:phosphoglycerate mutase-like protein [Rhizopogon vinicolor AM-OR11-026]|uniref:Phosphoglycerate mutase-like protein n=1 Tax=Rhizopogon vinicolor AM-OR11-026 TaxID=1314800 RepID=A0A1B7N3R2_9AGAM|nr:phosphoglycerate mutase-like protein [Rhizopogon vinicolor AM-OR11-026]